jgi:type I restriction enzyme S subunit
LIVSTGFAVLSAVSVPWAFLYQAVIAESFVSYLVNHAKGAAYPAVGAEDFEDAKVLLPESKVLSAFNSTVEPMARLISTLQKKNSNLRTARDYLLPKLISGELDVSDMPEPESIAA